jgi:hypothetical protein
MRSLVVLISAVALTIPSLAGAADPAATPVATPPAAAPSSATTPSTATPPPATAPTAPAPAKAPEYTTYVALKGGWFGSQSDFEGDSFSGAGTWEIAYGTGRILGVEFSGGSMVTKAADLEVTTVPLLLSLRLQVPIAVVYPFAELGAGLYLNRLRVGGVALDDATLGFHGGLGCDVHLGRVLVGAQARYMGISPTFETIGTLTLDRYEVMLRAGYLF